MRLEITSWNSHQNMLIYSYLHYCEQAGIKIDFATNRAIRTNCAILYRDGLRIFFDFSDSPAFSENPELSDFYFKRSLFPADYNGNVHPLNFHVNYSYKTLKLLSKINFMEFTKPYNRVEVVRALDVLNIATSMSHHAMDVREFPDGPVDHGGNVLFHTRLWNPENNDSLEEKERRRIQNDFRIEACRLIKKNFKNASAALFPEPLAIKIAPDLLLPHSKTSKKEYFNYLRRCDIGIADDGLKDTPGWKIGEYLMFGKAVISTPINIVVENFVEDVNYSKLSGRSSYDEIPDKISDLLKGKKYLEMGRANHNWSNTYLKPESYFSRIINIIESRKNKQE